MEIKFVRLSLIAVCILSSFLSISQEIKGTVFDENKKPIQGASIYLDGTTTGTSTDLNGEFSIKSQKINASLIISFIGYETIYVNEPFKNNNQKFYLAVKNELLPEIVIGKELFTRKQKMRVFKAYFLGKTKAGKFCTIVNEDDIDLVYDYDKNILTATSRNPIQIFNNYLGYDVRFDKFKLYLYFSQKSISEFHIRKNILYIGTSLFKTLSESEKIVKRRITTFYGSKIHFFKNLTQGIWDDKNFILLKGSIKTNPKDHFLIKKETNVYKITILKNDASKLKTTNVNFTAIFNLLYNKKVQSRVIFRTTTFYVDDFGNHSDAEKIEFGGAISYHMIGDMLPINYEPNFNNR